jgi:hypothetical protein
VDRAFVLEVQVQAVRAGRGHLGVEGDGRPGPGAAIAGCAVRVDVQVGQVALAQRHEMAVRGEVGLKVGDRSAVTGDGQDEFAGPARFQRPAEMDGVAVDDRGRGGCGERALRGLAWDGGVDAQRERHGAGGSEVRERPVRARSAHRCGDPPGPVAAHPRVHVPEAGQVTADDDEMLDVERRHRPPVRAVDPERELTGRRRGRGERVAAVGDEQAARPGSHGSHRLMPRTGRGLVGCGGAGPGGARQVTGTQGSAEHGRQTEPEGTQFRGCVHRLHLLLSSLYP